MRRIFDMTLDGYGTEQIVAALSKDYILTSFFYWQSKGLKCSGRKPDREPYRWSSSTVARIVSVQEYCGDVINFKTYFKSYKNKKRIGNDPENWNIFKEVREPIVDREIWEQVQQKRCKIRKRTQATVRKICFRDCLFTWVVVVILIFTSIMETRKSSISTALTTTAADNASQRIMSG